MVTGEVNVRVTFVIAEQYIKTRLMKFDEIKFKDERFKLGAGYRKINALGYVHQRLCFRVMGFAAKVRLDTFP